eukprot:Lithocolla_globosa_v1_NODE_242_length_4902_cov_29.482773.p1 type:complete len:590 gc:universal NODE_242_length_4902_cov_29.482773:918-2687(+)
MKKFLHRLRSGQDMQACQEPKFQKIQACGITLEGRKHLLDETKAWFGGKLRSMTTTQVCERYIKVVTRQAGRSTWAELAQGKDPGFVAPVSQRFVSHAWSNLFVDLLAVLDDVDAPIWLDLLILNQNEGLSIHTDPQCGFMPEFDRLVADIKHTVLVLSPWQKPVALGRCWVLWELYNSIRSGAQVEILLTPSDARSLEIELCENFNDALDCFSTIDLRRAESYVAADKIMIFHHLKNEPKAFENVNALVLKKLREWIFLCSETALQSCDSNDQRIKFLNVNGRLQSIFGNSEEAGKYFRLAADMTLELGDQDPSRLTSLLNVSFMLERQGHLKEAEEICRKVHQVQDQIQYRECDFFSIITNSRLAGVLYSMSRFEEAETLYRKTLDLLSQYHALCSMNFDEKDEQIYKGQLAEILNNLALVLTCQRRLDEAEKMCLEGVEITRMMFSDRHPTTMDLLTCLARIRWEQGDFTTAEGVSDRVVEYKREILGSFHEDTLSSLTFQASILEEMGEWESAKRLYDEAIVGYRHIFGAQHTTTLNCVDYFEKLDVLIQSHSLKNPPKSFFKKTKAYQSWQTYLFLKSAKRLTY